MPTIFDDPPQGIQKDLDELAVSLDDNIPAKQDRQTPYAVSFRAGETTFILVTLHIDYGDTSADRIPELTAIARWMRNWARRTNRWEHNLLTLGDFNIDREGSELWQAFTSTGLTVPEDLTAFPRSIFDDLDNPNLEKYYDQVAWFESGSARLLDMEYEQGGSFNYLPFVYTNTSLSKNSISYRMSDHFPLWVEFNL